MASDNEYFRSITYSTQSATFQDTPGQSESNIQEVLNAWIHTHSKIQIIVRCKLLGASEPFQWLEWNGKSSLIQTLLLLRQSFEKNALFSKGYCSKVIMLILEQVKTILSEHADAILWNLFLHDRNQTEFIKYSYSRNPIYSQ